MLRAAEDEEGDIGEDEKKLRKAQNEGKKVGNN